MTCTAEQVTAVVEAVGALTHAAHEFLIALGDARVYMCNPSQWFDEIIEIAHDALLEATASSPCERFELERTGVLIHDVFTIETLAPPAEAARIVAEHARVFVRDDADAARDLVAALAPVIARITAAGPTARTTARALSALVIRARVLAIGGCCHACCPATPQERWDAVRESTVRIVRAHMLDILFDSARRAESSASRVDDSGGGARGVVIGAMIDDFARGLVVTRASTFLTWVQLLDARDGEVLVAHARRAIEEMGRHRPL